MSNKKFIPAGNEKLIYSGRIDFENKNSPKIFFPSSLIKFNFTGKYLCINIKNHCFTDHKNIIGYFIDKKEGFFEVEINNENIIIEIPIENNKFEHEFILFKRQDGSHFFEFNGFYIDEKENILTTSPLPNRKIECYGDSVCVGYVNEIIENVGKVDPEIYDGKSDNSWYSFPTITSRLLNAQLHNISQGGMALLNGTGYCFHPFFIGLETIYDKLCFIPNYNLDKPLSSLTNWDFNNYIPNLVLIAIGQNDPHHENFLDNDITNPDYRNIWKSKYKEIISVLSRKYPNATFILMTTILMHNKEWDNAIDEIKFELKNDKIHRFYFRRNGQATPGHPRIPEQEEMAVELTEYIMSLGDDIWINTI